MIFFNVHRMFLWYVSTLSFRFRHISFISSIYQRINGPLQGRLPDIVGQPDDDVFEEQETLVNTVKNTFYLVALNRTFFLF